MPTMNITRSVEIDANANEIFPHLNDFNKWIAWSPWLLMEPEARVSVAEDAKSYEWEGDLVGSGNMKVLSEKENKEVYFDLNFLKPWKSSAKTSFHIEESQGKSIVSWKMGSSLPFFLFWMKKSMEAFVGADYERGLDMLKAQIETGNVLSDVKKGKIEDYEGCQFIGIREKSNLDHVAESMSSNFGKLWKYAEDNASNIAGEGISIYHKWDLVNNKVDYTAAFPVKHTPDKILEGSYIGTIPETKAQVLHYTGAYKHLGNAWSTGYTMLRNKKFKSNKKIDPFEIYVNNPSNAEEKDLKTNVYFPCK